jgi:long-chain acyl-CoA synthetase
MPTYNLAYLLERTTERFPDREAVVCGAKRWTFAQLNAAADSVAAGLAARGIEPGDRVALSCVNSPDFTVAYFAILKAGATVVPLNVLLRAREIEFHLRDSGAKAYLCFDGTPELPIGAEGRAAFEAAENCRVFVPIGSGLGIRGGIEPSLDTLVADNAPHTTVETDEDDTAVILYTSGTTGNPKGAELRHRNMRDNALLAEALFGADERDPDRYLCVLPLFHSFGQTVVQNSAIAFGGTIVMMPRFEPAEALDLMASENVTFFAGVPTMYWSLLPAAASATGEAVPWATLRVAVSGGAALPVAIHEQFENTFGLQILEGYGLSETSPVACFTPRGPEVRVGSIGRPVPGVDVRLLDPNTWSEVDPHLDGTGRTAVGEIAIRGHNVMKGYFNNESATAAVLREDWFRTGDLAVRDQDGYYYIVDRSKDMIIRGGFNVYPREIEEILCAHPDISLAAVVGVPHDSHGEEIHAYVILQPGVTRSAADIVSWTKTQVAAYKYPRTVEIVETLPMTATGKILKRELRTRGTDVRGAEVRES